jgi:hypothetical protein
MTKLGKRLAALACVAAAAGCHAVAAPVIAHADGVTYTVEPFDYDSIGPMSFSVTQKQLGGSLCPCVKVPYPADGFHNDQGVAALAGTALHAGDTVAGFSLGAQVISLYLARNTPPPGVRFVLLGDTFARNDELVSKGEGIPPDIANQVVLVARQYDGWSDSPTLKDSPHYQLALQNAQMGAATIHDYVNAHLDDPANVVTHRGNITAILIPTQHLPINKMKRMFGSAADDQDAEQRAQIDSAYDRPSPTAQQLAASGGEQR